MVKEYLLNKRVIISFLLSIFIVYLAFSKVDPYLLLKNIKKVNIQILMLSFLSFYLAIFLRAYRWKILLNNIDIKINMVDSFIIYYLSMFINSIVPGKIGDILRGYFLKKKLNTSISKSVGTVVIERILDLFSMLILIFISIKYVIFNYKIIEVLKLLTIFLFLLIIFLFLLAKFSKNRENLLSKIIYNFSLGLKCLTLKTAFPVLILSIFSWFLEGLTFYFIFMSLNCDIGVYYSILLSLLSSLLTAVPLTPSGLGVLEYILLNIIKTKNIYVPVVIILYRLVTFLSIIVFGFIIYLFYEVRLSKEK